MTCVPRKPATFLPDHLLANLQHATVAPHDRPLPRSVAEPVDVHPHELFQFPGLIAADRPELVGVIDERRVMQRQVTAKDIVVLGQSRPPELLFPVRSNSITLPRKVPRMSFCESPVKASTLPPSGRATFAVCLPSAFS